MPDDVRTRFAPVAANYTRSTFHSSAERLQEVIDLARPKPGDLALDAAPRVLALPHPSSQTWLT